MRIVAGLSSLRNDKNIFKSISYGKFVRSKPLALAHIMRNSPAEFASERACDFTEPDEGVDSLFGLTR